MAIFSLIYEDNFERIVFCHDKRVGLKSIIAIHNTALGPATGGCRMWDYKSEDEAVTDVLRLAKGMTYKASISKLSMGGGKSIIIGDPTKKTPELLKRYGDFGEAAQGGYVTALDVGISCQALANNKPWNRWRTKLFGRSFSCYRMGRIQRHESIGGIRSW